MFSSSIITPRDLARIVNQINPIHTEEDNRAEIDKKLKLISDKKIHEWPNSTVNANKNKLEERKRIFLEAEIMKRKTDEEEQKFREKQNQLATEKASRYYFDQQELVRSFRNKMQFCDMLGERKVQMQQSLNIKKRWDDYDKYWDEVERMKMEAYDRNELRKKQEFEAKRQDQIDCINQQFQEAKIKKIKEMQELYAEGQLHKIQAERNVIEEQEKKERERQKRQKENEDFKKANQELEKYKELNRQKEKEEELKIEEYAKKKKEMEDLRRRKEKEKFDFKQAQRQKLIDHQYEILMKIKDQADQRIARDVAAKEEQKHKEELLKKEKYDKMQREIKEDRRLYLERLKEEKEREQREDKILVENWKKEVKEGLEKERNEYLARKKKEKELQQYRLKQAQDRKQTAYEDFMAYQFEEMKKMVNIRKEKDDFLKFAEEQIRDYKNRGKEILPMLLELKRDKINGLV